MLNKLSRKDIELLNILAQTPEDKSALNEYIEQHEKPVKAYKAYRESVVAEVEVDKVVKPVETKRKFKVGDKVRVTSVADDVATTYLSVGDITEVIAYKRDSPKEWPFNSKRQVIVKGLGYFKESALELIEEKSPNELRAEIIQRAKEFVGNDSGIHVIKRGYRYTGTSVEFVVNENKRAVVALMRNGSRKLVAKGIAKCSPDDVYNLHIGKAIALGRALGKDVSEFENAVQPTAAVGQAIEVLDYYDKTPSGVFDVISGFNKGGYPTHDDGMYTSDYKIINDTDAIYEEV